MLEIIFPSPPCPHFLGTWGNNGCCSFVEATIERGAHGRTNFSCNLKDQTDYENYGYDNYDNPYTLCPAVNERAIFIRPIS